MNGYFTAFDQLANGIFDFISYYISIAKETVHLLLIALDFNSHTHLYFSWLPPGFANTLIIIVGAAICFRFIGKGA